MDEFVIRSVDGIGSLTFSDRVPTDPNLPIQSFCVRVAHEYLSALVWVEMDLVSTPATFFRAMSEQWRGWPGDLSWESLGGELALRGQQDRAGHVSISVELRSGPMWYAWEARATVFTEAGQLEGTARRAEAFFGMAPRPAPPAGFSS